MGQYEDLAAQVRAQKESGFDSKGVDGQRIQNLQRLMPQGSRAPLKSNPNTKAQAQYDARDALSPVLETILNVASLPVPMGKAAVGAMLGTQAVNADAAFRPTNSTLSRNVVSNLLERLTTWKGNSEHSVKDLAEALADGNPQRIQATTQAYTEDIIKAKLSPKELKKYGTEDFLLDPYLATTRGLADPAYKEQTLQEILSSPDARIIAKKNELRADMHKYELADTTPMSSYDKEAYLAFDKTSIASILRNSDDIVAASRGTPVYELLHSSKRGYGTAMANTDIGDAAAHLTDIITEHGVKISPENSLQQILAKTQEAITASEKAAAKDKEQIASHIQSRTAQKSSTGGFVELSNLQDLSDETAYLEHCIGAVRDGEKWKPAMNPITGELHKGFGELSSAGSYLDSMKRGESKFYSYRPEGVPQFTVEVGANGRLKQAYGAKDRVLTSEEGQLLNQFQDFLGITM